MLNIQLLFDYNVFIDSLLLRRYLHEYNVVHNIYAVTLLKIKYYFIIFFFGLFHDLHSI